MRKGSVFLAGGITASSIILLAGASIACAAVIRLSFAELAQRSRYVIAGEVVELTAYRAPFHDAGEVIFTDVKNRIDETLKGSPEGNDITVQVLGGKIGESSMVCFESAKYELGEKVLVFLRDYHGRLWNTGWLQGKYRLADGGAVTKESLVKGREGFPLDRDATIETVKGWVTLYGSSPPAGGTGAGLQPQPTPAPGGSR